MVAEWLPMKALTTLLVPLICAFAADNGRAQDTAKIDSVSLFKNGLAVVRLTDNIPQSGKLTMSTLPDPVHGTFWIQSKHPVTAKVVIRSVDTPLAAVSQPELLQKLVGKTVTVHLKEDSITGEVLGETREQRKQWSRDYASVDGQPNWWNSWSVGGSSNPPSAETGPKLVFLKTAPDGKVVSIRPQQILRVEFDDLPKIQRERPVLELESAQAGEVRVEYLTKGLSWAPSYRIDISDPKTLSIAQKTVIRNELTDLRDVEFRLISGFPSVRFGGVDSPISARQTWTNFFQQLTQANQRPASASILSNSGIAQQISVVAPGNTGGRALGPADQGESVDLHYQSVGRHSLAPGESIALDVATAKADYERVVEWNIADTRAPNGRHIEAYQRQQNPDKFDESAWDAIIFANPFDFPMTTAPAMLVHDGKFQGQQTSTWTNPGDQTSVRVTKALSVSARSTEQEITDSRKNLRIAGNDLYQVRVEGELTVNNHRGKSVVILIKRRFSGDLLEASDDPDKKLLEAGIYSINPRNELSWRITLEPGAEKVISYQYEVLVD